MKTMLILALLFTGVPAFACKMSEASRDVLRLSEAASFYVKTIETNKNFRVSRVRINRNNLVTVEGRLDGQCLAASYSVKIGRGDCSPEVELVQLEDSCE